MKLQQSFTMLLYSVLAEGLEQPKNKKQQQKKKQNKTKQTNKQTKKKAKKRISRTLGSFCSRMVLPETKVFFF